MCVPVRRYGALILSVAILSWGSAEARAQVVNPGALPGVGINANIYANPLASPQIFGAAVLGQGLHNVAVGQAVGLARGSLGGYGLNGFGLYGAGYGALGRGTLAGYGLAGHGFNGYGLYGTGYGSLANGGLGAGLYGGGYLGGAGALSTLGNFVGLGYGGLGSYYSGMNTAGIYSGLSGGYQGYLTGAAAITNANANYWRTITTARIQHQEALRSAIQTRRAQIEEAEYERAHMPDPEKIRQDQLRRELDHARVSPPLTEIWSGNSLNVLLRNLITQQGQGVRGPNVGLNEDNLKSINLTTGDSRANVGLLKGQGNLTWPQSLNAGPFKEAREKLSRGLKDAFQTASVGNAPSSATLSDLDAEMKRLQSTLDANVNELSPDQFIEAKRYLRLVNNAITALKAPDVANWFNDSRTIKSKNVAELVKFMADKGLWFAPAAPGDESSYLALYHALAAYDAATARLAGSSGGGNDGK